MFKKSNKNTGFIVFSCLPNNQVTIYSKVPLANRNLMH